MQLVSVEFAVFFLAALAACRAAWSRPGLRVACLVAASYVFYASMHVGFALLLLAVSLAAFASARLLVRLRAAPARRAVLAGFAALVLGDLCFFKYYAMLYDLAGSYAGLADLGLALPVGISFFTFQAIGMVTDAYRDPDANRWSLSDTLAFMAFFPTLLSGPILRAGAFIPQLRAPRPAWTDEAQAFWLVALGLFKKITLSSYLTEHVTRPFWAGPEAYSSAGAVLAAVAYSVQIFLDFSGYSDLAQGMAGLLGFRVPDNFRSPYAARNLRQFWRGWHISLSTWLRDYLYVPLGGSRVGPRRRMANLMVTMGLGGLWHGAGFNYLAWGLLHGVGLCATHWLGPKRSPVSSAARAGVRGAVCWAATFAFVTLAWVFFAAPDTARALDVFLRMAECDSQGRSPGVLAVLLCVAVLAAQVLKPGLLRLRPNWFARLPDPALGLAVGALAALAVRLGPDGVLPFIYFSF
ncbi:hypothetical protein JCM15519_09500 [Fundidesulfovibrio butyratiphilus]